MNPKKINKMLQIMLTGKNGPNTIVVKTNHAEKYICQKGEASKANKVTRSGLYLTCIKVCGSKCTLAVLDVKFILPVS